MVLRPNLKTLNPLRGWILSLLTGSFLLPVIASAGGFPISLVSTNSSLHLRATTVPAGRLVWFQGSRANAITNVVQIEAFPLVQHDFTPTGGGSAAFFRAAMIDKNVARTPVAVGATHSLAILTNGMIVCWGQNGLGQFGNDLPTVTESVFYNACWYITQSINTSAGPLPQSSDTNWISVAAGDSYCLALKADGTMWGWGDDTQGQLGVTNEFGAWTAVPVQIGSNQVWQAIFASRNSSFAIRDDGTLWAWGANGNSVLGLGSNYTSVATVWKPTQVGTAANWVKVVGWPNSFSAGIQSDGTLWAWGNTALPSYIRAGYAATNYLIAPITTSPALANIPGPWVDISVIALAQRQGVVALRADGTLWANQPASFNNPGVWAELLAFQQDQYTNPASLYNILVGAGYSSADALAYADSALFPFNVANLNFAAMVLTNSDANLLQSYSSRAGWAMVDQGIALNQDGTAWIIGDGTPLTSGNPQDGDWRQVNADTDWRYVCSGFAGIKADGHVWTWEGIGPNNGAVSAVNDLVKAPATNKWLSARTTGTHVVALDIQSNLWVWGGNSSGELGLGDNKARLTPTALPMAGPWRDYAVGGNGNNFSLAIRQNGELWAWGNFNLMGTNVSTPVRLNPERAWRSVFANQDQAYLLGVDGTLWAFGNNALGTLGLGVTNVANFAAPQQIAGSNWSFVSHCEPLYYGSHTMALKTDGTLWAWGYNRGDLALPYVPGQILTTPTQVPGSNWMTVAAGYGEGFGIQSNGTLWAWGGGPPVVATNDLQYPTSTTFESILGIASLNVLIDAVYYDCVHIPPNPAPSIYPATTNYVSTPLQVGTDTDWKLVYSANQNYPTKMALKQDGSLWVWGKSPFGSVTNSQVYLTPPTHPYPGIPYLIDTSMVPVPQHAGTNVWVYVDPRELAAVTTSGDLYLWGQNPSGQLLRPPVWLPAPVISNVVSRLPTTLP